MGVANGAARAEPPAGGFLTTVVRRGTRGGARIDLVVLCALSGLLIGLAAARRDFLGDGVRHLPAVLATHPKFGEPRWLLFPAIAWTWVRALSGVGVVTGADSAIQALLWMCVASGIAYLHAIRSWLVLECGDASRRAAALLLAGSCAPVLILFSDIAEPQIAAAVVICGLLYARRHRDDLNRANQGALVAIVAIAIATLMYQGAILALGMLPLVAYPPSLGKWRLAATAGAAVFLVFVVMIGAQVAAGTTVRLATTTAVAGERNPLTRSLMGRPSAAKYVAAIVAGPPQGVVALENFSGIPSLVTALRGEDAQAAQRGILNASRLLLGCVVVAILVAVGIRTASWRLLIALAVLLVLPVLRNQQDGYPKFFVLWPIPVALLAVRCRTRTIVLAAAAVLISNAWIVARDVRRGRELSTAVQADYARATPTTCWFTSGWSPPVSYLWPGTTVPLLGVLATGNDPVVQASALTVAIRRCFCESDAVWTDTSSRDAGSVTSLARHFAYTAIDLESVLVDPAERPSSISLTGVHVYPIADQQRICSLASGVR